MKRHVVALGIKDPACFDWPDPLPRRFEVAERIGVGKLAMVGEFTAPPSMASVVVESTDRFCRPCPLCGKSSGAVYMPKGRRV